MSLARAAGLVAIAAIMGVLSDRAVASAYEFTTSPVITDDSSTYTLGVRFTTNTDVIITRLGYYDYLADGLNQAHSVGIFDGTGNLLASTTVPAGFAAALDGHYRYVSLTTPLALAAGTLYVVAGVNSGIADAYAYGHRGDAPLTGFVTDPAITITDDAARFVQQGGTTLQFPTDEFKPYTFYGGPNFEIAVPEPASLTLIASALTVGWFRRSFHRRRVS